jgi:hypothetical protein
MATSFSGGRSRSTRREPPTMGKQLVNIITCDCESSAPLFVTYKAGHFWEEERDCDNEKRSIFVVILDKYSRTDVYSEKEVKWNIRISTLEDDSLYISQRFMIVAV